MRKITMVHTTKTATKAKSSTKTATKRSSVKARKVSLPKNISFRKSASTQEIVRLISEATELTRTDVTNVIDCLEQIIAGHLKRGAAGVFKLAGLMKVELKRKPATKARKGRNPFTGAEIMIKAKPARNVVKVRALKKLSEMAE